MGLAKLKKAEAIMSMYRPDSGDHDMNRKLYGWHEETETEIRFVVDQFNAGSTIAGYQHPVEIEQFYFPTPRHINQRIRVMDGSQAIVTKKVGFGINRSEIELKRVDAKVAKFICDYFCLYRIRKARYQLAGGWSLDIYHEPVDLVVAEYEGKDAAEKRNQLPDWMIKAEEITDIATNADIARWGFQRSIGALEFSVREMLDKPIEIVIDGGPGSGKTTILERLKRRLGDRAVFTTESARLLIEGGGVEIPIGNEVGMARFERGIYLQHQNLLNLAMDQARRGGKKFIVSDRGHAHPYAYLDGNLELFEQVCQTSLEYELARADLAIFLEMPPESVHAQARIDDPTRWEPYAEAVERNRHLEELYQRYGDRLVVIQAEEDFEVKVESVYKAILHFMDSRA